MERDNTSYEDGPGLHKQWAGNCDIIVVNTQNRGLEKTLEKAYQELYLPTFPLETGNDTLAKWKEHMDDPSLPIDYTITIAGDNLRTDNPQIRGMCVSAYFKDSDTGYLAYIVVNPHNRTEGLGHALFRIHEEAVLAAAVRNGRTLRGCFLDCDNPLLQDEKHQNSAPSRLVQKYQKWGGRQVPCHYQLPDIQQPEEKIASWILMAFPHPRTGLYPESAAIIDALKSIYRNEGMDRPEDDSHYQEMAEDITRYWQASRKPQGNTAYAVTPQL